MAEEKQISMAASAIALRGVRLFLNAHRAAAERKAQQQQAQPPKPRRKPVNNKKLPQKTLDGLVKGSHFAKLVCLKDFSEEIFCNFLGSSFVSECPRKAQ